MTWWLHAATVLVGVAAIATLGARLSVAAWGGAHRGFTAACGVMLALVVGSQALAATGLLNVGGVIALGSLSGAANVWMARRGLRLRVGGEVTTSTAGYVAVIGGVVVFAACIAVNGPSQELDTFRYHIVNAASLLNHGSLWTLPYAEPGEHTATSPGSFEAVSALLMLATHDDRLAYLPNIAWLLVLGWAGVIAACRCGARPSIATAIMVACLSCPVMIDRFWHSMLTDAMVAAASAAAIVLWLSTRRGGWSWQRCLCIGLLMGVAAGGKNSGVLEAVALAIVMVIDARPLKRALRTLALLGVGITLVGGIWYMRNWVDTGNPVWPLDVRVLGHSIFPAPSAELSLSPQAMIPWLFQGPTHLAILGVSVLLTFGPLTPLIRWLRHGRPTPERTVLLSAAAVSAFVYLITPYAVAQADAFGVSLNLRFAMTAVILFLAVATSAAPPRVAAVIAGICFGHSAWYLAGNVTAVDFMVSPRRDLTVAPEALCVGAAALAVLLLSLVVRSRSKEIVCLAVAGFGAALTTAWPGVPGTKVLASVEHRPSSGPVAVVMVHLMREVLGPTLDVPIRGVGEGPEGAQRMLEGAALTDAIVRMRPSLVIVGGDSLDIALPRWSPPATWRVVAHEAGATVYEIPGRPHL